MEPQQPGESSTNPAVTLSTRRWRTSRTSCKPEASRCLPSSITVERPKSWNENAATKLLIFAAQGGHSAHAGCPQHRHRSASEDSGLGR